jgi:hypothetical protein
MTIIPDDLINGPGADLLADETQFSAVLLDRILKDSFLFTDPVSINPTGLGLLPLERGFSKWRIKVVE